VSVVLRLISCSRWWVTSEGVFNNWDAAGLEIGEMPLHADDITAILNNWDATKYDGSQDVQPWLTEIEEKYQIYGIPEIQMTDMAVKSTNGEVNTVLTAIYKARVAVAGEWSWADFKEFVTQVEDGYRENMKDAPPNGEDGGFRFRFPYAAAAFCVILMGAGAKLLWPAILVAIGFGSGGVAAGSLAAFLQSMFYGGATGGVFSVLQALGATTVVSTFATLTGFGLGAVGAWCPAIRWDREEPAGAEP